MNQKKIVRARNSLASKLPPVTQIVRGALLHRLIRHPRGCPKCDRGEGHPAWVLTISYPGGKTKQFSLRPAQKSQVQRWLRNYHRLKRTLEAICELNLQLLRAEP